ncbi:MAG: excinuclease ABC subunit UvrC [Patescibacteria group bacterium]|nr:excinuclease ABC subunit UvrC [Patescibacteria group bacterium]
MQFPETLLNKIKTAPKSPGCYIYRNKKAKILYIGKAVNIKNRVNSYFSNFKQLDPKIALMIAQVKDVEFITTDSELEALILETNLIKKYQPKYNRMMKDDKNYSWLMISKREDFPRIYLVRDKKIKSADYFGPYADRRPIQRALKQLRKIFPYRSCNREIRFIRGNDGKLKFYSSDKKPCLYFHLNLCDAPCTGDISKQTYRKNVNNIKHYFRNRKFKIIETLEKEMKNCAERKKFENAAIIRNKLEDLKYIAQRMEIEKDMDEFVFNENKKLSQAEAVKNLIEKLKISAQSGSASGRDDYTFKKGFRIECYDISNISGKSATGSMVVFVDGKPDKASYRKFKIKTKTGPDDFAMLKEVFERRFKPSGGKKSDKSFNTYPDLVIVDGGKGQLSSVLQIFKKQEIEIPVVGLAKKEEMLFKFENRNFRSIKLPRGSKEFFLVQRIRDEAHRFAIKYHRILRSKKQVKSVLDEIPGIGKVVRRKLLKAFGSAENIRKAKLDELQSVVKNRKTVENIKKLLK